jgi:hypothetical protein
MPLVFEKLIPYHIKTIVVACTFFTFSDLAILGLASRVLPIWVGMYSIGALVGSASLLTLADSDARRGYLGVLGFLGLHTIPAWWLTMPPWLQSYRILLLGLSGVSVIAAKRRMHYLEQHWDTVVLSVDM